MRERKKKSQIRALDRSQPGLPMKKGRGGTLTHGLQTQGHHPAVRCPGTGATVVGQRDQRHRHQEFLKFLRRLDEELPAPVPLHLVMDNNGTHKKLEVRDLAEKASPFRAAFCPTVPLG
jgi:hypothetical protein